MNPKTKKPGPMSAEEKYDNVLSRQIKVQKKILKESEKRWNFIVETTKKREKQLDKIIELLEAIRFNN